VTRPDDVDQDQPLNAGERLGVVLAVCVLLSCLLVLAGLWPW